MKYIALIVVCMVLASCNKSGTDTPDITTGLVANIPLDGNGYDSVSNTSGTSYSITGGIDEATNRHGALGKAMSFIRADSNYIDMGDLAGASFPDGKFTISCWVLVSDTSNAISVLSKRSAYGPFEYSLDNHFGHGSFKLDNWISNGGHTVYGVDPLNAEAKIMLNTWQHIAFVGDGSVLKAYLNGVATTATDQYQTGNAFSHTGAHFVIGNGGGYGANNYFNGAMDDIKIYNRALDTKAIKALAQQ